MKIQYLGPESNLVHYLTQENVVSVTEDPLVPGDLGGVDCIVSYNYRHKIPLWAVDAVAGRAVNLHISYLPWNRGANPNYWSWHDDTPKGVTIHYVDEHFDTGDIIVQRAVHLDWNTSLRETYAVLQAEIQDLFVQHWGSLFSLPRRKQDGTGSVHTLRDPIRLPNGWDTPCYEIMQDYQK